MTPSLPHVRPSTFIRPLLTIFLTTSLLGGAARDAQPHWFRFSSLHFTVLANTDEEKARQAVLPFEQMRAAFSQLLLRKHVSMPTPALIIVFRSASDFHQFAGAESASRNALFLTETDRNYILLNGAQPDSWRELIRPLARMLLDANYPPAQPWFDEGFVEYFASLQLSPQAMHLGGLPTSTSEDAGVNPEGFPEALSTDSIR